MNEKQIFRIRIGFTGMVSLAIWTLLAWNHFHGGVPSHHLFADKDMPEISNWWGGLLLPLLSWLLFYPIKKRLIISGSKSAAHILFGFLAALAFGVLLSVFFALGNTEIPGYMFISVLIGAFFFPVYRAECFLGFVMGMTFTFGTVIPILAGSVLGLAGVVFYRYFRPAIIWVVSRAWR